MFARYRTLRGQLVPFLLLLALGTIGRAEDLSKLTEQVTAAKTAFQPITVEQVGAAKSQLLVAKQQLEAQFAAESELPTKLRWEALEAELAKKSPDLRVLQGVFTAARTNEPGLETAEAQAFRRHLLKYVNLYNYHANKQTKAFYEQQLDRLAKQLKAYEANPSTEAATAVGRITGFLESAQQADQLVAAIRQTFWRPNLYVQVSERMASTGMAQSIAQGQAVNECILGTSITGSAYMTGSTGVQFLESEDRAAMAIVLNGTANSSNVGRNRGVTINSTATTSVFAQKQVAFDTAGLSQFQATANASTASNVNSLYARSALVRRIAWKRVNQQKGQAQRIASQITASRIASQFDVQSQPLIADTQKRYMDRFRNPLLRRGGFPRELSTSTNDSHLFVKWLQASEYDAAATTGPPAAVDASDLFVRLHESMVGNMSQAAIGGVTLTDEMLAKLLKDMDAEVPDELKVREDEDPWSITFANFQPISVKFGDQTVRLSIRGQRFTRGDIKVNDEMEIASTYKIVQSPSGVRLLRQGDVVAAYVKKGFERADKIAIKTIMRRKFSALFKEELKSEGIAFPGRSKGSDKLHFEHVKTTGQWVALGWNLDAPPNTAARQPAADEVAASVLSQGESRPSRPDGVR